MQLISTKDIALEDSLILPNGICKDWLKQWILFFQLILESSI